jgi:hypothetical protein
MRGADIGSIESFHSAELLVKGVLRNDVNEGHQFKNCSRCPNGPFLESTRAPFVLSCCQKIRCGSFIRDHVAQLIKQHVVCGHLSCPCGGALSEDPRNLCETMLPGFKRYDKRANHRHLMWRPSPQSKQC